MQYCSKCGAEATGSFCSKCGAPLGAATEEKADETVRSLYALRAGLSVISQKADEARPYEENIKKREERRSKLRSDIEEEEWNLDSAKKRLADTKELEEEDRCLVSDIAKFEKINAKGSNFGCLGAVFILAAIVGGFGFLLSSCTDSNPETLIFGIVFGVSLLLAFVFNVIFYIKQEDEKEKSGVDNMEEILKKSNSEHISDHLKKLKERHTNLQLTLPGKLLIAESEVERQRNKINKLKESLKQIEGDADDLIYIYQLGNEAKDIYTTLVKDFSDVLDPRDWENLDIIIYMLETRRADSMRDALNKTDSALRHEDIKSTLLTVGAQIQRSISALSSDISRKIGKLTYEIAESGKQTSAMLGTLNTSVLNASDAERALLEKAGTDSRQLMSDVGRLRHFAELDAREKGYIH